MPAGVKFEKFLQELLQKDDEDIEETFGLLNPVYLQLECFLDSLVSPA